MKGISNYKFKGYNQDKKNHKVQQPRIQSRQVTVTTGTDKVNKRGEAKLKLVIEWFLEIKLIIWVLIGCSGNWRFTCGKVYHRCEILIK